MNRLRGVAASSGVSVAPPWHYEPAALELPVGPIVDAGQEITNLQHAVEWVASDLERRAEGAGGELAEILEAQAAMARDPELLASAEAAIKERSTPAARAIVEAGEVYAAALEASESEYMAARAADVRDVCTRVARRLTGTPEVALEALSVRSIIVATDLPPADVGELDPTIVAGIVLEGGSRTSHTAIVARSLGIPAVVAVEGLAAATADSVELAIDGSSGEILIDPDPETRSEILRRAEEHAARRAHVLRAAAELHGPAATMDGHRVEVAANVGTEAELRVALEAGAESVGLFRTELMYLDRAQPPSVEEQAHAIGTMVELLDGRRLVVRTFDFGADKPVPFLQLRAEANPALGVRGIRLAQRHPDLLEAQLRATVEAARAGGRVAIMAPMVATVAEASWFLEQAERSGARDAGIEIGVMVEVPAAIIVADQLATICDFVSIGTNDLNQYLHAADRQEGALAELQDPYSPALVRSVKLICEAAKDRCAVAVCGEAAGDPEWALVAVGLGVEELSMGSDSLAAVRVALNTHTLEQCRAAAAAAVAATTADEARAAVEQIVR